MFKWIGETRTVQTMSFAGKAFGFMRFILGFIFASLAGWLKERNKAKPKPATLEELRVEFYMSLNDVDDQEMLLRIRNFWGMARVMWILAALYMGYSLWNLYFPGLLFGLTIMALIYLVIGYQIMIIRQCAHMPYRVFLRMIRKDYKQALPLQSPQHWADKLSSFRKTMQTKLEEPVKEVAVMTAHIEVAQ
jgi:hypothetical protein